MAAGCKAAARLSRLSSDYQITIIERNPFISISNCGLPLYAAGEVDNIFNLSKTPFGIIRDEIFFRKSKGVKVLTKTEAEKIDTSKNKVVCKDLDKNKTFELPYNHLILATGAEPVEPNFPFTSSPLISSFHSPDDAKNFRQAAQSGKIDKAVIIGSGFTGCEMIGALTSLWGIETVLIEKEETLLPGCLDAEISRFIESKIGSDKIQLLLSTTVERIELNEKDQPVVVLENGQKIESDYVFHCLGVKPNSKLVEKANIKLGAHGGILVDEQMKTNVPNIWAAGDCVEIKNLVTDKYDYLSFGSLSSRMGRIAADSIGGRDGTYNGSVGSSCLILFNNTICSAGLTQKRAKELGYNTGTVIGCMPDRAEYDPDVKTLVGKLVYEKPGLKLLGLQLVGEEEGTRYIDAFSVLLSQKKTVEDLVNLEHCYEPVHSSPISLLNYLGSMAIDQEKDGVINAGPIYASSFKGTFVDLREYAEVDTSPFPEKSVHIPSLELRGKINDFDLNQQIMFVCGKGPRGYEAARIFLNNGFKNVSYLGGGSFLYNRIKKFL